MDLVAERHLAEAVLKTPARLPASRLARVLVLLAVVVNIGVGRAAAQKFYPDDPLVREPAPLPAPDPSPRNLSVLLEAMSATFGRPGERQPGKQVIGAQSVNTLGDVLDGPWYVNRHGRTRMTPDELRRGSGDGEPPSPTGRWHVLLLKNTGLRSTLVFRDDNSRVFILRFDARDAPELATGAEMISSRFFHALGYYVPETYLTVFERDRLLVDTNATDVTSNADVRPLRPEHIDRLLDMVARRDDGRYRAVALRVPADGVSLAGPYQLFGTRSDDPNDVVPHEHRRDLRGLQVFSAWLNHAHMDALHTFDVVVQPPGGPPHLRHYLFDFGATLGSGLSGPKAVWEGRDRLYGQEAALRNISGLGFYTPAWMRAKYPALPSVGAFDALTFDPEKWNSVYDLAAFANRLPDDAFWAARQVVAFTDDDIRAIVEVAHYSDPQAGRWIADCLIERRNRIGRTYFAKVLPLDGIGVHGDELTFVDLALQHHYVAARDYRIDWLTYDNQTAKPSAVLGSSVGGRTIPAAALDAPLGSYVLGRITATGSPPGMAVSVYLRRESDGLRVIGIDREWPGRSMVDPRIVMRPVRNRYVELDPARQRIFDSYARAINVKLGEDLTPEARFRMLSPSEQTTFDAITHALLHSPLTDDRGQPLGTALDLVVGLSRIAGEQTGRSGDQQFRIYVVLRENAREVLQQSREFVRSPENTAFHAGYPHSYRLGSGVPSIQFSVAEDGLSADVDVDYRTSKAPQALFNGHLTSSNSDVRAGDNAQRHSRRWNGFGNWWSEMFGTVRFGGHGEDAVFAGAPTRPPTPLPANRTTASVPDIAEAVQEFLTDWIVRRNYEEAAAFLASDVLPCVASSLNLNPASSPEKLRQASLRLLEKTATQWGRPTSLTQAMNPVLPWSPAVRVIRHAFERDFTIVEAPAELGGMYECGATPPKNFVPASTPEYGKYYGALLQVVQGGRPGGAIVLVWRRVNGDWRLVSYRALE